MTPASRADGTCAQQGSGSPLRDASFRKRPIEGVAMNRALLVGINEYPSAPLRGCVNDVVGMADLLVERFGFAHGDIRLVVDRRATTRAIVSRLGWLLVGAQSGDRLLFYYSGQIKQTPFLGRREAVAP